MDSEYLTCAGHIPQFFQVLYGYIPFLFLILMLREMEEKMEEKFFHEGKNHFSENSDDWLHKDTVLCGDIEHKERWSVPLSPVFCSSQSGTQ